MAKAYGKIVEALMEAGVEYVFGMPGGGTIPIWDTLYDHKDKIKVILSRHEQVAACMADIYGRITGKPGVLIGQGPFISTNGAFGIMESYAFGSPMVVLTDTSESGFSQDGNYQSGTGEYGSYDLNGIMRSICKYNTYAVTPEEAVHGVQLALKHATTGRPGPACVVMRNGAISGDISTSAATLPLYPTPKFLNIPAATCQPDEIKKTVQLILSAKRPVIIAGSAVHNAKAYKELEELATLLGIPVATSYRGKSAIAETHPLALGMMGTFGQKIANDMIANADVLIVTGCRLSPSDIKTDERWIIKPEKQKIIQIDIEPRNIGWVVPVEVGLVGDVKDVLLQLLGSLRKKTGYQEARSRLSALAKAKVGAGFFEAIEKNSNASPIVPQRIVREVTEAVDEKTLITLDAGENRLWFAHLYQSKAPGSIFCPGGVAGMGWGPGAALAVKLLNPNRPVLAISGDGGFAMVSHVLATSVQFKLPVVFLVINNSILGWPHHQCRPVATQFSPTDFAAIARGYGCNGVTIDKPAKLGPAIKKALKGNTSTVINVITTPKETYHKLMVG